MQKRVIKTSKAPEAIGPYSQAVSAGGFIFISGQIPLDAETGRIVDGDIEVQTDRVMRNIMAILEAEAVSMGDVVKTTVYLADLSDFERFNRVYAGFFTGNPPARATVQVSRLPRDVKVEIDAVALVRD